MGFAAGLALALCLIGQGQAVDRAKCKADYQKWNRVLSMGRDANPSVRILGLRAIQDIPREPRETILQALETPEAQKLRNATQRLTEICDLFRQEGVTDEQKDRISTESDQLFAEIEAGKKIYGRFYGEVLRTLQAGMTAPDRETKNAVLDALVDRVGNCAGSPYGCYLGVDRDFLHMFYTCLRDLGHSNPGDLLAHLEKNGPVADGEIICSLAEARQSLIKPIILKLLQSKDPDELQTGVAALGAWPQVDQLPVLQKLLCSSPEDSDVFYRGVWSLREYGRSGYSTLSRLVTLSTDEKASTILSVWLEGSEKDQQLAIVEMARNGPSQVRLLARKALQDNVGSLEDEVKKDIDDLLLYPPL